MNGYMITNERSDHMVSNRITSRHHNCVIWSHRMTTSDKAARRRFNLIDAKNITASSLVTAASGSTKFAVLLDLWFRVAIRKTAGL